MFFRRSKYMDFFICALFIVLLVYAYFSRRVLLDKLRREEEERLKLEHNANSLKEELKIVYYHTSKLEEALKVEQDRHKSTTSRLSTQSQDFKLNMTMLQKQYTMKLKEKSESISAYMKENKELKEKHKALEKHFLDLAEEHKLVAAKVKHEYDTLKQNKDEESMRLQDQIQETYNQKVYFQKKALLNEEDYKKTLKKLVRCKSILSRRNATQVSHKVPATRDKRKVINQFSAVQVPPESHVGNDKLSDSKVKDDSVMVTTKSVVLNIPVTLAPQNINVSLTEKVLPNRYNLNSKQKIEVALPVDQTSNTISNSSLAKMIPPSYTNNDRSMVLLISETKSPSVDIQQPKLLVQEKQTKGGTFPVADDQPLHVVSNVSLIEHQGNKKTTTHIDLEAT